MRNVNIKLTLSEAEFLVDVVDIALKQIEFGVKNDAKIEKLLDKIQTSIEVS